MITDEKIEILRKSCYENHIDSFMDEDDFNDHFDEIVDKLNNLDDVVTLHRVVFIEDISQLNTNNLGSFWVEDEDVILDEHFRDYLQNECNGERIEGTPFQIEAKFKKEDIEFELNVYQYLLNPQEEEITIKENAKPVGKVEVFDCENNKYVSDLLDINEQKKKKSRNRNRLR